jgi:4-hydroxy-2-oxoheptanedioate aldolase
MMQAMEVHMKTTFKQRLTGGENLFGSFAFMASADVVEIMGLAGFDYAIIDLEHSPKNWEQVAHMIRAAELHGMAPLVRIRENTEKSILEVLELGAAGAVVPFVQSREDVEKAVRAVNYWPRGQRGTCTLTRAARYGSLRSEFVPHTQRENDRVVLIAQIEDQAGLDNIEAITSCKPGLDGLIVGRSDLASSLGAPGQVEDPKVIQATHRIIDVCRANGVPSGIGLYSPAEAAKWIEAGCNIFFYSADTSLLMNAAQAASRDFHATAARLKAAS